MTSRTINRRCVRNQRIQVGKAPGFSSWKASWTPTSRENLKCRLNSRVSKANSTTRPTPWAKWGRRTWGSRSPAVTRSHLTAGAGPTIRTTTCAHTTAATTLQTFTTHRSTVWKSKATQDPWRLRILQEPSKTKQTHGLWSSNSRNSRRVSTFKAVNVWP